MPRWVRWTILGLVLVGIGSVTYALLSAATSRNTANDWRQFAKGSLANLEIRKPQLSAPRGEFFGPDRSVLELAAFRGQLILVNIWATWCAPCIREMPSLASLQQKFGPARLRVIAISVDRVGDEGQARQFLAQYPSLSFYFDPDYSIAFNAGARGFPTTILYDPAGQEIFRMSGAADWSSSEAFALIEEAIRLHPSKKPS